jgi:3-oxoacyl-[acyl-carrier-protein] synthase II
MHRRVVITGMGWVTPLGLDLAGVWSRLLAGDNAIAPVTHYDASTFATNFAAEVKGFDFASEFGPRHIDHSTASPSTRFALVAAKHAWERAGLDRFSALDKTRMGIYMGSGEGPSDLTHLAASGLHAWDASTRTLDESKFLNHALATYDPYSEFEQEPNRTLTHLAEAFQLQGPTTNCMTACAASTQAIGEAFELIRRGDVELMFAGGAHSMIHPLGMTGFIRLTAMSQRRDRYETAARPFDQSRDGFVMGEGAAVIVLESLDHALARGATPLAELAGYGSSADAFRITDIQPEGKGAIAAMSQACAQAGIDPRTPGPDGRPAVHYISAHGTGTQENDKIETLAVKGLFGELAYKVPFSSVKSMMGHLIQAAGAAEFITCVQAIRTGHVPPTMNLSVPDPLCDLDYVANAGRDLSPQGGVRVCLSNSFGFGGQNDTLCVRAFSM